ncbi:male sterility protein-domain-containing protein [Bisporella sp. PMI_857]|nr:male sterility protein-domain-containing protein [Bisporella sp. PMI_857]
MEIKLKEIWQRVIGSELSSHHQIDAESDFFHIGGNSLALVNVQGLIKTELNVELTLVQLFENPTLGALARQIDPSREAIREGIISSKTVPDMTEIPLSLSSTSTRRIEWQQETAISDDLYELEINPEPKDQGLPFKTVVITGATGFLGKELLRRMIHDNHIDKIHAIAVRRRKSDLPAIFSDPKVELHQGDLKALRLGLSEAKAREIFAETDAVIHNGADVSFMKAYTSLFKANVGSTRELVKLCLPFHVPIHFVSSAGVAHLSGKTSFSEESVAAFEPPRNGTDGYIATKWVSERFLELVSEKFSVPVWIHRPSNITGDDAPDLDIMTNILTFSKKMCKVPISSTWRGTLDFVSVERVAADILDKVKNDSAHTSGMVKYVHECGDLEVAVNDMKSSLERQTGQKFEATSLGEWTKAAVAEGLDELVATYLNSASKASFIFPKLLKTGCRRPQIDNGMEGGARRANLSQFSLGGDLSKVVISFLT